MVCYSSLTNSPDQNVPRRVRMLWQEGQHTVRKVLVDFAVQYATDDTIPKLYMT